MHIYAFLHIIKRKKKVEMTKIILQEFYFSKNIENSHPIFYNRKKESG